MSNTIIQMDSYKKTRIKKEIFDLEGCILLNNYYLEVLKPDDPRYAEQKLLLADNLLNKSELEKQLEEMK